MLSQLLLISLPILSCHATYLDPSLQQQRPLAPGSLPATPSDTTVLPLSLNEDLTYTFPSTSPHYSHHHHYTTPLHRLQSTAAIHATHHAHSTITVSIPLSASHPATVSFSSATSSSNPRLTWVPQNPWDAAMRHMPLIDMGIRKGGMLSMDAQAAVLDLSTPFIALPKALWDVLVLATQPVKATTGEEKDDDDDMLRVECGAMSRFPDLVLGVIVDEGAEEVKDEFVISPEQYVLQREDDECLLLAREAEGGENADVGLGWAAVRGRDVVFDWEGARMGFGEVKG